MLELGGRGSRRERAGGGGLGCCSQASKKVRPRGARCWSTVVLRVGLLGGFEVEALQVRSISTSGSKARTGQSQSITGWEIVVGHLSKTACVHTRSVMFYRWVGWSEDIDGIEEIDGREVDVERVKAIELATSSEGEQAKVLEELDDRASRSDLYVEKCEDYVVGKTARVLSGGKPLKSRQR
jgi:hypothetical protein